MEERDGGRDRAKGAKAKDTEARAGKDLAAKVKERANDTEAKTFVFWI